MWGTKLAGKRIFLLVLFNLALGLFLVQFLSDYLFKMHSAKFLDGFEEPGVERFAALKENLPEVLRDPAATTLFFGTSVYEHFLDPISFDNEMERRGVRSLSFNLAFSGFMGPGNYTLAHRIYSEARSRNARVRATVFEFSPVSLSRRFYESHKRMLNVYNPKAVVSGSSWLSILRDSPPDCLELFLQQVLRPVDFGLFLFPKRFYSSRRALGKAGWPGAAGLWEKPEFREKPAWNIKTRGLSNWNLPSSAAALKREFALLQKNWDDMISRSRRGNALDESFVLDRRMMDLFIRSVNIGGKFSKKNYIVLLPYAPTFQRYVDQYVSLEAAFARFAEETDAEFIDLRNALPVTDADFVDAFHLRKETMNRFLAILADRL